MRLLLLVLALSQAASQTQQLPESTSRNAAGTDTAPASAVPRPQEDRQIEAAESQAGAQWLAVWVAVLAVFIAAWQARMFLDQLRMMKSTLGDAKTAAEAAQASAAASANQAAIGADTLRHLRDEFAAEQRPWVSVEITTADLRIKPEECVLPITFVLRNSGRTPALHARVFARLYFHSPGATTPVDVQTAWIAECAAMPNRLHFTVFPGVEDKHERHAFIDGDDLKAWRAAAPRSSQTTERDDRLVLLGAVVYYDTAGNRHQTGFINEVYQPLMDVLLTINPHYSRHQPDGAGGRSGANEIVSVRLIPSTFGSGTVD